jgi:methylthioribose-1-phosphate isomerase
LGFPATIRWVGGLDGYVELLDQTLLPGRTQVVACKDVESLWEAIRSLRVRGAPALGVAAAMGVVLGVVRQRPSGRQEFGSRLEQVCGFLGSSRPTAVNLFWALQRMQRRARELADAPVEQICEGLLQEAEAIRWEDQQMCEAIGRAGAELIREGAGVLTHCNAGALATAGPGTALAPMYEAQRRGRRFRVYVDETRPLLQGSRLTAWELSRAGIDVTLLCDNMAGWLMKQGRVDLVLTGADRIAANGDTANKIGTYSLAVLARAHGVAFYVAAPASTFDLTLAEGSSIPIEQRPPEEVRAGFGRLTAPTDVACYNPAFDVTPAELISGVVTDRGILAPVGAEKIAVFFGEGPCKAGSNQYTVRPRLEARPI